MASRDAVADLERILAAFEHAPSLTAIGQAVDETLGRPDAATFGVAALTSVRDAIAEAYAAEPP
jgi:hypothetical protein